MDNYIDLLNARPSQLCVGIDPSLEQSNETFLTGLIEETAQFAGAFKPNFAFFEQGGIPGLELLAKTIEVAHAYNVPVILDAKRGDIGKTATAYARAAFDVWGADAVTVNAYLGRDSVEPWVREGKGVYILCHTSNPGAVDLQHQTVGGRALYLTVAEMVNRWNLPGTGLVVGATFPEAIKDVRQLAPLLPFLIPGVGAQGGDLEKSVAAALQPDGKGLLINASSAISNASSPTKSAQHLFQQILNAKQAALEAPVVFRYQWENLVLALFDAGCVKFGDFVLKSGLHSPIYIDLRMLVSYPNVMWQVARAYIELMENLEFERIAAIPYAALPIGMAVSFLSGKPLLYPRDAKGHGTMQTIEGAWNPGDRAVVLDDLITTGTSKFEAIEPLTSAGINVHDIVVLINREQGGQADLEAAGYRLHSVLTLRQILTILKEKGKISPGKQQEVLDFLYPS